MHHRLDSLFDRWRPLPLAALAVAVVIVLGALDDLTGFEISFSIFYLVPIALVAWYAGTWWAAALCLISAATWLYVDLSSGHTYSHPAIPAWNALVRFGFFSISASLLVTLRAHLRREEQMARRDSLTGLLNSRAFREEARIPMALAVRHRQPFALGYLDLDDFKLVNDQFGHVEGDRALVEVAALLESRLRESDLVGRLGGDEFAILLPSCDLASAEALVEEMTRSLREHFAMRGWPLGVSVGVAVFDSAPASFDDALRAADALMYQVKGAGKGGHRLRRVDAVPTMA